MQELVDAPLVLLVEDNPDDAYFLTQALRTNGIPCRLEWARDGREAQRFLSQAKPALVLLDINMPRCSSLELLQDLNAEESQQGTPIVVWSASKSREDKAQARRLGACSFEPKPADFDELMEFLDKMDRTWLHHGPGPLAHS